MSFFSRKTTRTPTEAKIVLENGDTFKLIFDKIRDGIILADVDTKKFVLVNEMMCQMLGYSNAELLQRGVEDMHPPKDLPWVLKQFERQAQKKEGTGRDIPMKRKDGSIILVDVNSSIVNLGGKKYILGIFRDTTEERRAADELQKNEELLRLQMERLPIGYIVWDTNFRVVTWNPAAEEIFGFSFEEAKGRHPYDLIVPSEVQPQVDSVWRRLLAGDITAHSVNENQTKDGRTIVCDWTNTPLRKEDGTVIGAMSMVSDITIQVQAEKELRESEEKFSAAFHSSPSLMAITRLADGTIIDVNEGYSRMLGYSRTESIGKTTTDLSIWADPKDRKVFAQKLQETGQVLGLETKLRRKDGGIITVIDSAQTIELKGEPYILSTALDVTEKKREEVLLRESAQELQKYKEALDAASEHIILTDSEGITIYANRGAEEATGYTREEMVGKNASLWGRQMPQAFYADMWKIIKEEKKNFNADIVNRRKDGTIYDSELHISPILDERGEVKYFIGVEQDITRAKEIDRAKSEFISLASHQLRTPMTAINWYTEMLLGGEAGELNEKQTRYFKKLYASSRRMDEILNSFLYILRLETGKMVSRVETVNIPMLEKETTEEFMLDLEKKQLHLVEQCSDGLPAVESDPNLIRAILRNLISNAVKYTPSGGTLTVTCERAQAGEKIEKHAVSEDAILLTVTDTGIGITQEDQEKIFTRFFRAENAKKADPSGNGLGLYIVKKLVGIIGGDIWLTSTEGKGTTFHCLVPVKGKPLLPQE